MALVSEYLLDQGPVEDVFWAFASVMDIRLRDYLSANPLQHEVDIALFSKALESKDPGFGEETLRAIAAGTSKVAQASVRTSLAFYSCG
jgi:hypothetical protein